LGTTAAFVVGTLLFFWLSRRELSLPALRRIGFLALLFDSAIVASYLLVYSYESGTPIRQAVFIPVIEAALRYGIWGGVLLPLAFAPVHAAFEQLRSKHLDQPVDLDAVVFPVGVLMIAGLIVGWLVERLGRQSVLAEKRAREAESLRDELGGRSAPRWTSSKRSARSFASCAGSSRSTAPQSSSPTTPRPE
jgi:glucose-6-phosphate-specific signal transduction histidine kinase